MFVILSAEKNLNWFLGFPASCIQSPASLPLRLTIYDSRLTTHGSMFHVKQKGGRPGGPPPLRFFVLLASGYYVAKNLFNYLLFYLALGIGRFIGAFSGWNTDGYFLLVAVLCLPGAARLGDCLH